MLIDSVMPYINLFIVIIKSKIKFIIDNPDPYKTK